MSWHDRFSYDSATAYNATLQRRAREKAAAAAHAETYRRTEEDICFRLIRSSVARERLEGYRRHITFLAHKHGITIVPCGRGGPSANVSQRIVRLRDVGIRSEDAAAEAYHEFGHVLCVKCPNDGIRHRRDMRAKDSWACVRCETDATARALRLAPFTKEMHHLLSLYLWTYEISTPAALAEKTRLKQIGGTVEYYLTQQRWKKWWDRIERTERARRTT
jgi:hypothetical protein